MTTEVAKKQAVVGAVGYSSGTYSSPAVPPVYVDPAKMNPGMGVYSTSAAERSAPAGWHFTVHRVDNGFILQVGGADYRMPSKTFVYSNIDDLRDRFIAEVVAATSLDKA